MEDINNTIATLNQEIEKLQTMLQAYQRPSGAYQCFHCCNPHSVIWDSDFSFSDMGYEGEGIVHICHCVECGAEIEYRISEDSEEE